MKKLLVILIPVFAVALFMTQVDEDLSEETTKLIDRVHSEGGSESFLYLYGIFASEVEDPLNVGSKLLAEYRKLDSDDSYNVIEYPDSEKLTLPTGDEFCKVWEHDCLKYIFSSQFDIEQLLREHRLLVSRSNRFIEFDEFKTLSKPTVHEIFPPYQYISAAERLKILEAISSYRAGNIKAAIDSLLLQFSKLRRTMELQDNLIGKLVILMKLSEIIDVLSVILTNEEGTVKLVPGLSQSEKSFFMIASREFSTSYYTFKGLEKHPGFFEIGGNSLAWITRIMYKPNMTINSVAPVYSNLERLSLLSPSDFANQIEVSNSYLPSTSKLRNYVGSVLISVSPPQYAEYVARFQDFEAKLALFNQVHHFKLKFDKMKNPYYGDEIPRETEGNLCFSGPLEDKRHLRCLKVKI